MSFYGRTDLSLLVEYRLVSSSEAIKAAHIHQTAGALIPGYDTSLHSREEYEKFYVSKVMVDCIVWGAFHNDNLLGFVALLPGWIDHLYVDPNFHRQGIGMALVRIAQREQCELRLYTFQANSVARRLYEKSGFILEELTDGQRNEEKMPDTTYFWQRTV
jgi:putative acetyltransferase